MRIVSLVPSWTETLIEAGIPPVGRTRYCIHPAARVSDIPIVGGTRDIDWDIVSALRPQLLLADRSENPRSLSDHAPCPLFVSHVTGIPALIEALERLDSALGTGGAGDHLLDPLRRRWVLQAGMHRRLEIPRLPAVRRWNRLPRTPVTRLLYMVWKDPWMAASRHTFIGSMLDCIGFGALLPEFGRPYARIIPETAVTAGTLVLLPSEPYPFDVTTDVTDLTARSAGSALVDGEAYAWYGIRSLRLLESLPAAEPPR